MNPEDAYDRLADALGLSENDDPAAERPATGPTAPAAEWSTDRKRLILTSPTTFEGSTQSFALQPNRGWKPLTFGQARALSHLRG